VTLDPAHLEALAGSVPAAELPGIYRAFAVDLARLAAELLAHVAAGDAAEARLAAHALAGAAAGIGATALEAAARATMHPGAAPLDEAAARAIAEEADRAVAALTALAGG
jgi:HPt (histidine-containing phosphotransfer) domain-containing protein